MIRYNVMYGLITSRGASSPIDYEYDWYPYSVKEYF